MFSALRKLPSVARNNLVNNRNLYAYVGRPREQLSIVETWCHGLAIVGGIFAIPVYVLTHICEYRGIEKAGKVGMIKPMESAN